MVGRGPENFQDEPAAAAADLSLLLQDGNP
jgi:hypothetical protein